MLPFLVLLLPCSNYSDMLLYDIQLDETTVLMDGKDTHSTPVPPPAVPSSPPHPPLPPQSQGQV